MKKAWLPCAAALTLLVSTGTARAGFGFAASIGAEFFTRYQSAPPVPPILELTPFFRASIVHFDLGFAFNLTSPTDFQLRPGLRVDASLLYIRVAVPLHSNGETDVLVGVGKLFQAGPVGLFLEGAMNFDTSGGFGTVPLEFRGGLQISF